MKRLFPLLLLVLLFTGCAKDTDSLVVVSKEIRREALGLSVAGDEFGSAAGSVIENVVVGKLENKGPEEARNVEVTFRLTGGGNNYALIARIPSIPAGKTVDFRTEGVRTHYTLQFRNDVETEIRMGRVE